MIKEEVAFSVERLLLLCFAEVSIKELNNIFTSQCQNHEIPEIEE